MIRRMVEGTGFPVSGRHGTASNTDNFDGFSRSSKTYLGLPIYTSPACTWDLAIYDVRTAQGVSVRFRQQLSTEPSTVTEPPTDNAEDDQCC